MAPWLSRCLASGPSIRSGKEMFRDFRYLSVEIRGAETVCACLSGRPPVKVAHVARSVVICHVVVPD